MNLTNKSATMINAKRSEDLDQEERVVSSNGGLIWWSSY